MDWSGKYELPTPDLGVVGKASENLTNHFLLKYLVSHLTYGWNTLDERSMDHYEPHGPAPERFLYGICWQGYVNTSVNRAVAMYETSALAG
jgi:hypothetical protein